MLLQAFLVELPIRLSVDGLELLLAADFDLLEPLQGSEGILNADADELDLSLEELAGFLLEPSKKELLRTPSAELVLVVLVVVANGFHHGLDS